VLVRSGAWQRGEPFCLLDLDDLLPQVDVLSLHCPLSPDTRCMIAAPQLAKMKRDAVLINTARGALVDPQALADALRAGLLSSGAIDLLSQEPPMDGDPLLANDIPNLILTPHIAWGAEGAASLKKGVGGEWLVEKSRI